MLLNVIFEQRGSFAIKRSQGYKNKENSRFYCVAPGEVISRIHMLSAIFTWD